MKFIALILAALALASPPRVSPMTDAAKQFVDSLDAKQQAAEATGKNAAAEKGELEVAAS